MDARVRRIASHACWRPLGRLIQPQIHGVHHFSSRFTLRFFASHPPPPPPLSRRLPPLPPLHRPSVGPGSVPPGRLKKRERPNVTIPLPLSSSSSDHVACKLEPVVAPSIPLTFPESFDRARGNLAALAKSTSSKASPQDLKALCVAAGAVPFDRRFPLTREWLGNLKPMDLTVSMMDFLWPRGDISLNATLSRRLGDESEVLHGTEARGFLRIIFHLGTFVLGTWAIYMYCGWITTASTEIALDREKKFREGTSIKKPASAWRGFVLTTGAILGTSFVILFIFRNPARLANPTHLNAWLRPFDRKLSMWTGSRSIGSFASDPQLGPPQYFSLYTAPFGHASWGHFLVNVPFFLLGGFWTYRYFLQDDSWYLENEDFKNLRAIQAGPPVPEYSPGHHFLAFILTAGAFGVLCNRAVTTVVHLTRLENLLRSHFRYLSTNTSAGASELVRRSSWGRPKLFIEPNHPVLRASKILEMDGRGLDAVVGAMLGVMIAAYEEVTWNDIGLSWAAAPFALLHLFVLKRYLFIYGLAFGMLYQSAGVNFWFAFRKAVFPVKPPTVEMD